MHGLVRKAIHQGNNEMISRRFACPILEKRFCFQVSIWLLWFSDWVYISWALGLYVTLWVGECLKEFLSGGGTDAAYYRICGLRWIWIVRPVFSSRRAFFGVDLVDSATVDLALDIGELKGHDKLPDRVRIINLAAARFDYGCSPDHYYDRNVEATRKFSRRLTVLRSSIFYMLVQLQRLTEKL